MRVPIRTVSAFAGLVLVSTQASADEIDRYVLAQMKEHHIPGASIAVLRNGRTIKKASYGLSNVELGTRATSQSVYMVGSISKQFLSACILALAADGRLQLDAPITSYIDGLPQSWRSVSVRNLMNHTSGIKSYTDLPEHETSMASPITFEELLKYLARYPLGFDSGHKWAYSNTGSYIEARIIERVTGQSYGDYARTRLWARAGMQSTRLNKWQSIVPHRVHGYTWTGTHQANPDFEHDTWPYAGGGVLSSLDDMVCWAKALDNDSVLSLDSLRQLWSPVKLTGSGSYPFGLDWFLSDIRGWPREFRTGHGNGFSSVLMRYPAQKLTVIVLTNQDDIDTPGLADGIASKIDRALTPARQLKVCPDPDPASTLRIKQATADLVDGKSTSPDLTPGLIASTTDETRRGLAGALKATTSFEYLGSDDLTRRGIERLGARITRVRHFRIRFGDTTATEAFYLDESGRLAFMLDE